MTPTDKVKKMGLLEDIRLARKKGLKMEALKKVFGRKPNAQPETIDEIPIMETEEVKVKGFSEFEPIYVKSMEMQNIMDVESAVGELRNGNIVVLNISPIMNQDPGEVKRAIDQLRDVCNSLGGDIGRLTESKVIATPKFIKIQFQGPGA
jgi:SepF-like predicted cell division protein (DUF552 family)